MAESTTTAPAPTSSVRAPQAKRPPLRMWAGCTVRGMWRLWRRHDFRVEPRYLPGAVVEGLFTIPNTLAAGAQELVFGGRVRRSPLKHDPLFVMGHWRTGTTLLHELLVLDERFSSPNSYQCFQPSHFLISEWFMKGMFHALLPSRRPMDNMSLRSDGPQEDEMAMSLFGFPTPNGDVAFPNQRWTTYEELALTGVPAAEREYWKRKLDHFLRQVSLRDPRRLVLKSPQHTCRLPVLHEMYPQADYVVIVRNPYVVFSSTMHLWKTLSRTQGLQKPKFEGLEEYVLDIYEKMNEGFERDRKLIDPRRICDVKYEELVRNPVAEMRRVYEHLKLGGFAEVEPRLREYQKRNANYQTNRYTLSPEAQSMVAQRWGRFFEKFGYDANEHA